MAAGPKQVRDILNAIPPDALDQIRPQIVQMAALMDEAFVIPGTNVRIGIDALLGLIPVVGDLLSAAFGFLVIQEAKRLGVSRFTRARMAGNMLVDLVVGAVPLVGDMFDVAFKANSRNLRLIRKHLGQSESMIIDVPVRQPGPSPSGSD